MILTPTRAVILTLALGLVLILPGPVPGSAAKQLSHPRPDASVEPHQHGNHHPGTAPTEPRWEGSPEGKAYSEFNHHLAGILVILIALSELRGALGIVAMPWSRLLLPGAMLVAGGFLLIWSDHEAWPIGSLTFTETLFSRDWEMVQHKLYAVLLFGVGTIEWMRRIGKLTPTLWRAPLPVFAIIGGLMLFLHSHGAHLAAQKIAFPHTVMGIMAMTAGACKLTRRQGSGSGASSRWELAWAALILLIGIDLLLYTE